MRYLVVLLFCQQIVYAKPCKKNWKLWNPKEGQPLRHSKNAKKTTRKISKKNCNGIKSDLFQDANKPEWFWSKDVDGHGGGGGSIASKEACFWKVFRDIGNNQFQIVGCADKHGSIIDKKFESTSKKKFTCK